MNMFQPSPRWRIGKDGCSGHRVLAKRNGAAMSKLPGDSGVPPSARSSHPSFQSSRTGDPAVDPDPDAELDGEVVNLVLRELDGLADDVDPESSDASVYSFDAKSHEHEAAEIYDYEGDGPGRAEVPGEADRPSDAAPRSGVGPPIAADTAAVRPGVAGPARGEPCDGPGRSSGSIASIDSAGSIATTKSVGSIASALSAGSIASLVSVGSLGSIFSIGSYRSILSIGSRNSILSIGAEDGFLTIGRGRHAKSFGRA